MMRSTYPEFALTASETPHKSQNEKGNARATILILRLLSLFTLASAHDLRRNRQLTLLGTVVADSVGAIVSRHRHGEDHQGFRNQGGTAQLHGTYPMLFRRWRRKSTSIPVNGARNAMFPFRGRDQRGKRPGDLSPRNDLTSGESQEIPDIYS